MVSINVNFFLRSLILTSQCIYTISVVKVNPVAKSTSHPYSKAFSSVRQTANFQMTNPAVPDHKTKHTTYMFNTHAKIFQVISASVLVLNKKINFSLNVPCFNMT